jgi:hypothetical protein
MKTNKTKTGRISMKGQKKTVGAPPKPTKFPSTPFTMAKLFAINSKGKYAQCELSLRNKVDSLLAAGALVALKPKRQAKGGVGRPKSVFVVKEHFDASKMESILTPAPKTRKTKTKTETPATVAVAEVNTPAAVPAPVIPTSPVETTPTAAVEPAITTANSPGPVASVVPTPAPVEVVPTVAETTTVATTETVQPTAVAETAPVA